MSFELEEEKSKQGPQTQNTNRDTDELEDALKPVSMPAPKPTSKRKATPVKTDRAPTVEEILDPKRPSLDGVSHEIVVDSIEGIVNDLYDNVFAQRLDGLKTSLAKTAPPAPTPFALTLLGWVVEQVATWTVGSIGKLAAKELFGKAPAAEPTRELTPVEQAMGVRPPVNSPETAKPTAHETAAEGLATNAAGKLGGALKTGITTPRPTTEPTAEPDRSEPGESLLVEFISQQKLRNLQKKHDAITTLKVLRASAAGAARADFVELDRKLNILLGSPKISGWFQHKVTMEWMNFLARVHLGPRATGQTTDMAGADVVDGIATAGAQARQKWTNGAGFVEITINVPDDVQGLRGLALARASIPSSFGSMVKLKDSGAEVGPDGKSLSLATLPVYRRVWLQVGSSKLGASPAFVITPDGQVEVDASNPALAAVGSGRRVRIGESVHGVGGTAMTADERADPEEWIKRVANASHAQVGAHSIVGILRAIDPGVLQ